MITFPDGRQFYSCPGDDMVDAYFTWLKTAKINIAIAIYSIDLPEFPTTLQGLNLPTRGAFDRSESTNKSEVPVLTAIRALPNVTSVVGTSSMDDEIMHHKFTVLDNGVSCQYGSWNYTNSASLEDNWFIIDPNPVVGAAFLQTFEAVYSWIQTHQPQG